MRIPRKSCSSDCAKRAPDSLISVGDSPEGPAITLKSSAASATVRAIGPSTPSVDQPFKSGALGTRPGEGRSPTTLFHAAGLRSDPPMSLPQAKGFMPQASDAAAPPLLPPADFDRSHGLRVTPKTSLNVCEPAPNSGVFDLPIMSAPALAQRRAISASCCGT